MTREEKIHDNHWASRLRSWIFDFDFAQTKPEVPMSAAPRRVFPIG
jgi:hypothetical protein